MDVIRWVNGEGSSMMAAHLLTEEEDPRPDVHDEIQAFLQNKH